MPGLVACPVRPYAFFRLTACSLFLMKVDPAELDPGLSRFIAKLHYCKIALLQNCFIAKLHYCKIALLQNCFIAKLLYCKIALLQNCLLQNCFIAKLHYCKIAFAIFYSRERKSIRAILSVRMPGFSSPPMSSADEGVPSALGTGTRAAPARASKSDSVATRQRLLLTE